MACIVFLLSASGKCIGLYVKHSPRARNEDECISLWPILSDIGVGVKKALKSRKLKLGQNNLPTSIFLIQM